MTKLILLSWSFSLLLLAGCVAKSDFVDRLTQQFSDLANNHAKHHQDDPQAQKIAGKAEALAETSSSLVPEGLEGLMDGPLMEILLSSLGLGGLAYARKKHTQARQAESWAEEAVELEPEEARKRAQTRRS